MSIPTVTITGNVLPPNNVAAGGTVSFELNTVAVDLGSGVVVPRKVSTPILSGGAISQAVWPNAAGEGPSRYSVYLEMIPALDGDCPVRIKLGEIAIPVSPSSQDIGALIAAGSAATGGAALLEFQFANRAALVAKVASGLVPIPGFTYLAGGLSYLGKAGATGISDLPGLVPAGDVTPLHFGAVLDSGLGSTNSTAAIQAAQNYTQSQGLPLYWPAGQYRSGKITISGRTEWRGEGQDATIVRTIVGETFTSLVEIASGSFIFTVLDMQINGMGRADDTISFLDYGGVDFPYYKSLIMDRCKVYGGIENQIYFGSRRFLAWVANSELFGGQRVVSFNSGADHRFVQTDFGGATVGLIDAVSTSTCIFTACHFYGSGGFGVKTDSACNRWIINGGACDTNDGDGMDLHGDGHLVTAVKFAGNALGGASGCDIRLRGVNITIPDNVYVKGSGASVFPDHCVVFESGAGNALMVGGSVATGSDAPFGTAFTNDASKLARLDNRNTRGALTVNERLDGNARRVVDGTGQNSALSLTTTSVGLGVPSSIDGLLHQASDAASAHIIDSHSSSGSGDPAIIFRSGRGTNASKSAAQNGDSAGRVDYRAHDGSSAQTIARAKAEVDGSVSAGVVPGRWVLMVANSLGTLVDRLRVTSGGSVFPGADNTQNLGIQAARWVACFSRTFRPGSGNPIWTSGSGSPEGVVSAPVGSIYGNETGGAGTTLYVKESGTGNTGWVAK